MTEFQPQYLSIDYLSLVDKFRNELQDSDIFKDFDFEGANISILLELMAYVGELTTFFSNKIAKNCFLETADVYEAANRLARQGGYEPKGTRSARGTITVAVSGTTPGDTVRVLAWKQLSSGRTDDDGNEIRFATTTSVSTTASGSLTILNVPIRQGVITDLTGYSGEDLIDNELILPQEYAYDDDVDDEIPSVRVLVNDEQWTRLSDFYSNLIPVQTDNVYQFIYDRYRRNKVVFNSAFNVPGNEDTIDVRVLQSLGPDGTIAADSGEEWTIEDTQFVQITPSGGSPSFTNNDNITISLSAATIGSADPETIDELKINAASALRAQFRNVTSQDYNSHLSSRSDIVVANAWGEQDLVPSGGDPQEFNIVHISVIPEQYGASTISFGTSGFTTDWGVLAETIVPSAYSPSWETELLEYLKPRKMISAYEIFELPDLVYFSFEIGIRKKRTYNFVEIAQDVREKLDYYFRPENQQFNSTISFMDIVEFLLDATQISTDDDFENIRGIRNLNIRDININKTIYPFGSTSVNEFPRWDEAPWTDRDNMLREVKLGLNQFPVLATASVRIFEES
jgi:hypothetical protein